MSDIFEPKDRKTTPAATAGSSHQSPLAAPHRPADTLPTDRAARFHEVRAARLAHRDIGHC